MNVLLIVDVQKDFLPGGALEVPNGDEVIPVINRIQPEFDLVIASQDWHPADHLSFASQHEGKEPGELAEVDGIEQTLWPDHCIQNTEGAEFADDLDMSRVAQVFRKGVDRKVDSYSAFFGNGHKRATGLGDYLQEKDVDRLFIAGLATDVCVLYTALDARKLNFDTAVVEDACRGIDMNEGDVKKAIEKMRKNHILMVQSREILQER